VHPWVEKPHSALGPQADEAPALAVYRCAEHMLLIYRWLTRSRLDGSEMTLPAEAVALRCLGLGYLAVFLVETLTTRPYPGLHGRGALILLALIVFVLGAVCTQPQSHDMAVWRRVLALAVVTAATAVLSGLQPNGIWSVGPYIVAFMAGICLDRKTGVLTLGLSLLALVIVSAIENIHRVPLAVLAGAIPWYLVMRLMRELRRQHEALESSRAAEADAAAAAERGRLAREMHDVLAHSLSALALQLESTRLLARGRGVDHEVTRALDQAHHLAASGLQDARGAIAAARGDELPGPERIGVLADAFEEQSGLPVAVAVRGEPRELAPDARLALYRTAQEALTNVRRHATAEHVEIELSYLPERTVLVVADHASADSPPPTMLAVAGNGYGLTGMRERAELLGGELLARPTDDGFRVELRLPT
jgi:signal transduction histidine kinase